MLARQRYIALGPDLGPAVMNNEVCSLEDHEARGAQLVLEQLHFQAAFHLHVRGSAGPGSLFLLTAYQSQDYLAFSSEISIGSATGRPQHCSSKP